MCLLCRAAVVRRRYGHGQSTLRSGRQEINLVAREARIEDLPMRLGPKDYLLPEFRILKHGAAVSKAACMTELRGIDEPHQQAQAAVQWRPSLDKDETSTGCKLLKQVEISFIVG